MTRSRSLAATGPGLRAIAMDIAEGRRTSREVVEAALARYRSTEPEIRAFAWLDEDRALRLADDRDRRASGGALRGVPIGVKDIFDTRGIPTRYGSRLFGGRVPTRSSDVVRRLEAAGAIVLGKTVTTEFAYFAPGPTRNPHDPTRTPGGSSQGSAAAVAAGIVAGAVGSQTNGSTIRPAAFCGVVGFKPSEGRISRSGAMAFSPTLDQVGVFAGSVDDAGLLAAVLSGDPVEHRLSTPSPHEPRLAAIRTSDWSLATSPMQERFMADVDALRARGARIEFPALPDGLDDAPDLVPALMAYESLRTIGRRVPRDSCEISQETRELWERGARMTPAEHEAGLRQRRVLIARFEQWMRTYDAVITLPAAGEAPLADSTGDPRFCSRWTLVGAPALVFPTGCGPNEMPLGLQMLGRRGEDAALLGVARWAESVIGANTIRDGSTSGRSG